MLHAGARAQLETTEEEEEGEEEEHTATALVQLNYSTVREVFTT